MSEEKKLQIKKKIWIVEACFASLMVIYLIYMGVTKNSNETVFHILAGVILAAVLILNDIVDPYLTKVFDELDEFRKNAYKKYVICDAVSYAGLLLFIITFGSTDSTYMFVSICMFVVGSRKKKEFRALYMGEVTKEDINAAKEAVAEVEAVEVTEEAEVVEETEAELETPAIEEKSIEE